MSGKALRTALAAPSLERGQAKGRSRPSKPPLTKLVRPVRCLLQVL